MDTTKFKFDLVDKYAPFDVIKKALTQIDSATKGYVIGNIQEYAGKIKSYTKTTGLSATLGVLQGPNTVEIDVQDSLGEQSEIDHRYEVFLSVKGLEKYKYRMMFVDYGALSYPVTIVLNKQLSHIYNNKKYEDTFVLKTMKQLEEMLSIIINSDFLVQIIQNLINEAIRRENISEDSIITNTEESE